MIGNAPLKATLLGPSGSDDSALSALENTKCAAPA
jgi:hypothetical protein